MFDNWPKRAAAAVAGLVMVLATVIGFAASAHAATYSDTSLQAAGFAGFFQQSTHINVPESGSSLSTGSSSNSFTAKTVTLADGCTVSVNSSGVLTVNAGAAHLGSGAFTVTLNDTSGDQEIVSVTYTPATATICTPGSFNVTGTDTVAFSPTAISFATDDNTTGGVAFHSQSSATTPPNSDSYQVTNLPAGLNGNIGTGELLPGTAIPGQYNDVMAAVTDSAGAVANAQFHLKVNANKVHPPHVYTGTIVNRANGECLDDQFNAGAGAVVQIWRCNGMSTQVWTVNPDGSITHNGLCLTAPKTLRGTKVTLAPCLSPLSEGQTWSTDHWHVTNQSGLVLDDTGWGGSGTPQELWEYNGGMNQFWQTF